MRTNTRTLPTAKFTHEGARAYNTNSEQELRRSVMACLLWEGTFYESGEEIAGRIEKLVSQVAPETVRKIAYEARTEQKLRHVPLLLAVAMAKLPSHKHEVAATVEAIIQRPDDFTDRIDRNVLSTLKPGDTLINLGDFGIGDVEGYVRTAMRWKQYGIKHILVRGNHDQKSPLWYMDHGFDFACDMMVFRSCLLTHKPWMGELPDGTHVNLHGHLHNVWDGFLPTDPEKEQDEFVYAAKNGKLLRPFHRLFAVEYTDYRPVDFDKFVSKPDKYQARGPNEETKRKAGLVMKTMESEKAPWIECQKCFEEEGSYGCVRASHSVPDATGNDVDPY